jgi:hypothetical protein
MLLAFISLQPLGYCIRTVNGTADCHKFRAGIAQPGPTDAPYKTIETALEANQFYGGARHPNIPKGYEPLYA